MNTTPILFVQALETATSVCLESLLLDKTDITLVRDLWGRIRILLPANIGTFAPHDEELASQLTDRLGSYGYPAEQMILFASELLPDSISLTEDRRLIQKKKDHSLWLLDRQIIGQDWDKGPIERTTRTNRVTFFGIKGGVGRSTALTIWAWHLANQGKRVLIFDFDLESPGISSTLLPQKHLPDFGIVDWFVEDAVGQAQWIENEMVSTSPLSHGLTGKIRIVPAYGTKTGDYLPKLNRCYFDFSATGACPWGDRVEHLVQHLEEQENPEVIFLDSRAGLHDIAAHLITRMGALTLLFAIDSAQTWSAYSLLFQHWKGHSQLGAFREKLQIVAGMIPETGRAAYMKRFREHAWDLFRDNLYEVEEDVNRGAFNFDLKADDAPHSPLLVFWHRALQEFDPTNPEFGLDEQTASEALGLFMKQANNLVFLND
ncbi:MAG: ParA family protein [Magnetococcales bacterium]|nr:ParA family protein [Magnetococcales bacterium]